MTASASARLGFTTIELLIVIAIVGILSAAATPLYVGWRADTRSAEAARVVETAIARARSTAKNAGGTVTMTFANDSSTFFNGSTDVQLPYDGVLELSDGPVSLSFAPPFGQQEPFGL